MQQCTDRKHTLKALLDDFKNLHEEQKTLADIQKDYLVLADASEETASGV